LEPLAHGSGDWSLPREDCIKIEQENEGKIKFRMKNGNYLPKLDGTMTQGQKHGIK